MTRMTGPDCAVMCNLINIHTYIHTMRCCGAVFIPVLELVCSTTINVCTEDLNHIIHAIM